MKCDPKTGMLGWVLQVNMKLRIYILQLSDVVQEL